MKTTKIILSFVFALLLFSCSKKDNDTSTITAEDAGINAKIDQANDDVANILENQFENIDSNSFSNKSSETETYLTTCAVVTRVPVFGTALTAGQTVTKTIDFGTTGCSLSNGNFVSGKIIMSFVYQPTSTSHTITYSFVNFYHNLIKYDGTKTYVIDMSTGHPVATMNMNMTATFPNGNVYTRVGQRIIEITAGYNTPSILDNVYSVTGSWTTTFPNSAIQTSTITSPLIIKMSCMSVHKPLIVQGVITLERNSHVATLDYGSGDCDNIAIFTYNGNSYTITIGN